LTWKAIRLPLLVVLLASFGYVTYSWGTFQIGTAAAVAIDGPFKTEETWIVATVTRNVAGLCLAAAHPRAPLPAGFAVTVRPVADKAGEFVVHASPGTDRTAIDETLRLPGGVWQVEDYAPFAQRLRRDWCPGGGAPGAPGETGAAPTIVVAALAAGAVARTAADDPSVLTALLDLTPLTLEAQNAAISARLSDHPLDAAAHDAAALLLGAFAMREAAGRLTDHRHALSRLTAHLVLARALDPPRPPTVAGDYASALLLALSGRGAEALAALDTLESRRTAEPYASWNRALRLRLTQDWRASEVSARASLLEQLEYFRARVGTLPSHRVVAELDLAPVAPVADWGRIALDTAAGVETGNRFVSPELNAELLEIREVWRATHATPLPAPLTDVLNVPADDSVGLQGVRVLGWGLWASFLQRHLVNHILLVDERYRTSLGLPAQADGHKSLFDREYAALDLYPASRTWRLQGPRADEHDCSSIASAVRLASRRPELLTMSTWVHLDLCARFEPGQPHMPAATSWFMPVSPRMPYQAGVRAPFDGERLSESRLRALLAVSPYDRDLVKVYIEANKPAPKDAQAFAAAVSGYLDSRLQYDVRARYLMEWMLKGDEWRASRTRTCELLSEACPELAANLAEAGREEEAAALYERVIADETVDRVKAAFYSGWLTKYYVRTGQTRKAQGIAEAAAGTGSRAGLLALAWLFETTGRFDEAEEQYADAAERYEQPQELIAFSYRMARVRHEARFEPLLVSRASRLFPQGLRRFAAAGFSTPPARGVFVATETDASRLVGIRPTDLIVALDGWRTETVSQYETVRAFVEEGPLDLTIWRSGQGIVPIKAEARERRLGIGLRSYPFVGWSQ
jgi:hypothetical protein